jgi:glutathione synthase/RimK-type ligase-like ATP-grasp enzyme
MLKIAFIVGKSSDVYRYKTTSKNAPKWFKEMARHEDFDEYINKSDDRSENNTVPSDVAMAMHIAYHHPRCQVTLINATEYQNIYQEDLDQHDVIFVIYDPIEVFHSRACKRRTCPELAHRMERMLENTSAFVYPHPEFHRYIISKPDYYADLRKAGIPVAKFFKATPEEALRDISSFRRKAEQLGSKGIIIKPSYAGYSLGIRVFKNLDRTRDETFISHFQKLADAGFPSAVVQEFVESFGDNYEIRTYWINERYACSVATLTEAVGHGDGLPIKSFEHFQCEGGKLPDSILRKLKVLGKKVLKSILQYPVKHPMIRIDFGCCLKQGRCEDGFFINEVETFAANQLSDHTDYPIVEKVAEAAYKFARNVKDEPHMTPSHSSEHFDSAVACKGKMSR